MAGDRRNTSPRSEAQNTRVIRREQNDMSEGVFNDIPASKVQSNGLYDLANAIATPWGVQGRTGGKLISLELPAVRGQTSHSRFGASQTGYVVTMATGVASTSHVRRYIWWPDGTHDRITAYIDIYSMRVASSATRATTSGCRIREEMNAWMWHSKARVLIIQIGSSLYWSTYPPYNTTEGISVTFSGTTGTIVAGVTLTKDHERRMLVGVSSTELIYIKSVIDATTFTVEATTNASTYSGLRISSWVPIYRNAKRSPSDAKSTLREYGDDAVLFASNGIYLLRLSEEYPSFCLLNDEQPKLRQADDQPSVYGRKLTMAFSAIDGAGLRDRSTGARVLQESATMAGKSLVIPLSGAAGSNTFGNDFWESWAAAAIGSADPRDHRIIRTAMQEIGYHWTHYTLYGTLDVGVNGIDAQSKEANNSERFYWMDDVPRIKCFLGTINGNTLASNYPVFSPYDVGSTIGGGVGAITITAFLSASHVTVTHTESSLDAKVCVIGTTRFGTIGATGATTKSNLGLTTDASITAADVGKLIWFSDGTTDIITAAVSIYGIWTLRWLRGRNTTGGTLGFAIQDTHNNSSPGYRYYRDTTPDNGAAGLRVRDGFLMSTRFLEPLPSGNVGAVCPGFIAVGREGGRVLCYSNTGDPRFAGYFHPTFQVDACDFGILALSEFEHALVGYGKNGYALWDLTDTKDVNDESPEATLAPLGRNPIVIFRVRKDIKGIGCLGMGAICKTRDGVDIVLTQNKEVRIFDGYKFGDNLIASRYQRKFDLLQAQVATHFDKRSGFLVWGTSAALTE